VGPSAGSQDKGDLRKEDLPLPKISRHEKAVLLMSSICHAAISLGEIVLASRGLWLHHHALNVHVAENGSVGLTVRWAVHRDLVQPRISIPTGYSEGNFVEIYIGGHWV
jgi:hypothetical protein